MWCLILNPVSIKNLSYKMCLKKMVEYNALPINQDIYDTLDNLKHLRLLIKKYFPDKDIIKLPKTNKYIKPINLDDKIELSKLDS